MVQFTGTYKRTKEANCEDFLSKMGVNFMIRKAATMSTPTIEITETSPGKWKMTTLTIVKTMVLEFELGVTFDEKAPDGRDCRTTITQEGDNVWHMKQVEKKEGGKTVNAVRKFSDEGIELELSCEEVVSKQFFTRQ